MYSIYRESSNFRIGLWNMCRAGPVIVLQVALCGVRVPPYHPGPPIQLRVEIMDRRVGHTVVSEKLSAAIILLQQYVPRTRRGSVCRGRGKGKS